MSELVSVCCVWLTVVIADVPEAGRGVLAELAALLGSEELVVLVGNDLHREEPVGGEYGDELHDGGAECRKWQEDAQCAYRRHRHDRPDACEGAAAAINHHPSTPIDAPTPPERAAGY